MSKKISIVTATEELERLEGLDGWIFAGADALKQKNSVRIQERA